MQTSYSTDMPVGFEGLKVDIGLQDIVSRLNPNVIISIGKFVCRDSGDGNIKHPVAATDISDKKARVGVALHAHSMESQSDGLSPNYKVKSAVNVMRKGRVWVAVEEAVTPASKPYVRYATGVADNTLVQKGAFRASPDGAAQVNTLTPTAVDSVVYNISIFDKDGLLLKAASINSGTSATATTIVTALKAALGTVPGITQSGTATLILTSSVLGEGFSVQVGAGIANVATTANSQSAAELKDAKFVTSASAGGLAQLEIDL